MKKFVLGLLTLVFFTVVPLAKAASDDNLKLDQLKDQYKQDILVYRNLEKEFSIDKDQYQKLQTLSSIEAVVSSGKELLAARNQVLLTYLQILQITLESQPGVNEVEKKVVLDKIAGFTSELTAYQQLVEAINDRSSLNNIIQGFISLGSGVKSSSDHALIVLQLAKLQASLNEIKTTFDSIKLEVPQDNKIKQSEFNRGVAETEQILDEAETNLQSLWLELKTARQEKSDLSHLNSTIKTDLNTLYTQLNKSISYLEELVKYQR